MTAHVPVRALLWTHGVLAVGFLVMVPVGALTPLRASVVYLVAVSNLALALSEGGAWQAARAEKEALNAEQIAAIVRAEVREALEQLRAHVDADDPPPRPAPRPNPGQPE